MPQSTPPTEAVSSPPETSVFSGWEKGQPHLAGTVIECRHCMKINSKCEKLWQKLEAELRKHGLEVASRDEVFRSRTFMAHVRFIGGKREALLGLAYASLDDWRQNEIDAAIAAAKESLKP